MESTYKVIPVGPCTCVFYNFFDHSVWF